MQVNCICIELFTFDFRTEHHRFMIFNLIYTIESAPIEPDDRSTTSITCEASFLLALRAICPCLTIEIASTTIAMQRKLNEITPTTKIVVVRGHSFMSANKIILPMAADATHSNWILRFRESPVNSAACLIEMDDVVNGAINRRKRRNVASMMQIEHWGATCDPQYWSKSTSLP